MNLRTVFEKTLTYNLKYTHMSDDSEIMIMYWSCFGLCPLTLAYIYMCMCSRNG